MCHPQASYPAEQSWRECGFCVAGLAGIQDLVDSYLQFHLIIKRADGVAGETAEEIYLQARLHLIMTARYIGFQATDFIHGYMTFWITNLIYSIDKIDNVFIIVYCAKWHGFDIFTIMRQLVSFHQVYLAIH